MTPAQDPALSVVLSVDRTETGAETIDVLRREAGDVPLELVLVGIEGRIPGPPECESSFSRVRRVSSEGASLASARAVGVRAATAPFVAIAETHCFPQPGWAHGVVERLNEGWTGVGPRIEPGNPARRAVALTLFDYGRWMGGPGGQWPDLPGHNAAYRRDALLTALERLPEGMEAENLLQQVMRADGGGLYLDLGIRVRHMNMEHYAAAGREWMAFSRVYACRRAADWGPGRRAIFAAGSPLLPLIRFPRFISAARRSGYLRGLLSGADMLAVALVCSALGELLGYATQRCDPAHTTKFELHRRRWAPSAP